MDPRPCFRFTTSADKCSGGGPSSPVPSPPPVSSMGPRRSASSPASSSIARVDQRYGIRGPCTLPDDFAGWPRGVGQAAGSTQGSLCIEHLKRTCAPAVQPPMDAPWGVCAAERQYRDRQASRRARSTRQGEVQLEAGMVRGCRLGVKETSGVCARRRREGARGTGVRARRRRAVADGGLAAVVRGGRGGRNRRGDRDAARTGGREPDGAGLRRPLDQPEAARPFPGPLLAGGREGRPAGRAGTRLGAAYRPALSATAGTDRPGDH